MANGSRHSLSFVAETVAGVTPQNPALQTLRNTGVTLGLTKNALESAEIRSDRMTAEMRLGANQVAGDINIELSCETFDELLQGALLSKPWAALSSDANLEEIKVGQDRKSFSFVRHFEDLEGANAKPYFIYRGCEINQLKLTVQANQMVKGSLSVFGMGQTLGADLSAFGTPTTKGPTSTPQLDSFTGELKEGKETIAVVTEIQLTLDNGIAGRFVVGSKDSIKPSLGRAKVTGTVTAFFEDSRLLEKYLNEEDSSMEFTLPDGQGRQMTFIIPKFKYTGGKPDVTGEGPITLSMPFTALIDPIEKTNLIIRRTKPKPVVTLTGIGVTGTGLTGDALAMTIAQPANLTVTPVPGGASLEGMTVTISTADQAKFTAVLVGNVLTVTGLTAGTGDIVLTVGSVTKTISVTVS